MQAQKLESIRLESAVTIKAAQAEHSLCDAPSCPCLCRSSEELIYAET